MKDCNCHSLPATVLQSQLVAPLCWVFPQYVSMKLSCPFNLQLVLNACMLTMTSNEWKMRLVGRVLYMHCGVLVPALGSTTDCV